MQDIGWKKFLLVAVAVTVGANLAGKFLGRIASDRESQRAAGPITIPQLQVVSSSQSADGVTEQDLSPQLAEGIARHGVSRITAKLEAMAKQSGLELPTPRIHSESTVIQTKGRKLAIIRYEINAATRAVEIIGISGSLLNRVMCTRDSLDEILITSGPCADKIHEVFGVKIGGS
jgi:hypothetical protein